MDSLREYAISIIVTTLICSAVSNLLQNPAAKGIIRMICGMVLTITVVAPLWRIELSIPEEIDSIVIDSTDAAEEGIAISRNALEAIIKQETEAYIQDKAAELHAEITVEITLTKGDPPIPESAVISGTVTPYQKLQLLEMLQTQLGIAKERLEWTG